MKRTDFTYGQLDKVLRSHGFSYRQLKNEPATCVYEHESGALIMFPSFPESDFVLDYHLLGARTTLDWFGIVDPKDFDAELQSDGRKEGIMKMSEITYRQLDRVLRSLGFSYHLLKKDPPARRYEHKETGALISIPPFPKDDVVLDRYLVVARTTLDLFGIADPKVFDAKLQKTG